MTTSGPFALRVAVAAGALTWLAACGGSAAPDTSAAPRDASAQMAPSGWRLEFEQRSTGVRNLAPVGYGTLSQDDITVLVQEGGVRIKVVPLAEWVIRLTAPDTYRRLNGYKVARGEDIIEEALQGGEDQWPTVFFVTFFSQSVEESFEPNDLQLRNENFLYRPVGIIPVTPGFGRERLNQQETQIALYLFSADIDLNQQTTVKYRAAEGDRWTSILRSLDSEFARASSRAGAGEP